MKVSDYMVDWELYEVLMLKEKFSTLNTLILQAQKSDSKIIERTYTDLL